jgi:predicted RNA binding protein YcfA (HicA-like mRNA interferase family)
MPTAEVLVTTGAVPLNSFPMGRAEKLAAKILTGKSDKNFAFNDLCYILERAGFQLRPGKGSHRIYYKDGVVEIVNVQPRNGKAKPYQVKQVRELLLKYKVDIE